VLAARRHSGPLRVQKALYPEGPGVCQVVVVHPPGGIVGGDSLTIEVAAGRRAHAQLTTPGAAKWYRSAGAVARSDTMLQVAAGALVEWLPQETMLFDGARASPGACGTRRGAAPDLEHVKLFATFSPELSRLTIYVIDVAAGDKIPR